MPAYFPQMRSQPAAPNSFAFVGDSRIAQMFNDGAWAPGQTAHVKTNHWINTANALLGQRIKISYAYGVAGYRSDQYLAVPYFSGALASGASWLVMHGVVNDIAQYATTGDTALTIWTRIKSACLQALNTGMNVILVGEPGATTYTTTQIGMMHQFNEYAREFCATTQGMYYFDLPAVITNPTASSSTVGFLTNYSSDGTHLTTQGHWYVGNAFANFISARIPTLPTQIYTANDIPSNGNIQQLVNPLFTTTTGGTLTTGVTGSLPANYLIQVSGTPTAVMSTVADPNGFGNNIVATCTFTSASDIIKIEQNTTIGNFTIPGDVIDSGCEVVIAAGSSNLSSVYMSTLVYPTYPNNMMDLYPYNSQALPSVAMDLVLRTNPLTVTTGTTAIVWGVFIAANGAGSATVTIKRPWLRRRYSL